MRGPNPDFIIIGAMKCATSTIHDQLDQHQGISMSDPKEPNFFSDEDQWALGENWYTNLFQSMPECDLKGESSTHYTKLPTYLSCVDRLDQYQQKIGEPLKFVYVMRDPIERIVSQFIHEWSVHSISGSCTIDEAVKQYPMFVEYSKYAMQLQPYIERFGIESVLPVFFERMKDNPDAELQRVANFIGYNGQVRWNHDEIKNVSSQRQRRNPLLNAFLDVSVIKQLRRNLLPESLRAKVRSRWTMKDRPVLSNEVVQYLHTQIDPDLFELGKLLNLQLDCEHFTERVLEAEAPEWSCISKSIGCDHD